MSLITLTNKAGKLKLSDAIQKSSVDTLLDELGKVFGAKAAAAGARFGGLTNYAQNAADTLEIEIHSPGGSVLDGYRVYGAIKELRKRGVHVTATINTLAASMASVVAMAADRVVMVQGGRMMIHEVSQSSGGTAADHARAAKLCDDMSNEIATIYAGKTNRPVKEIRELMRAETWMSADDAFKSGFIDAVVPINQMATLPTGPTFVMPTAEAIAAEVIRQQAAAPKPLTGLALTTAAFHKASAEKTAKAKPAARNPEISSLTGLAKVTASFSAQSKSSN